MPKIEKVDTTHIRIEVELKNRLDALAQGNESARDVIRRLLNRYETEEQGRPAEEAAGPAPLTIEQIREVIREEISALPVGNIPKRARTAAHVTGQVTDGNEPLTGGKRGSGTTTPEEKEAVGKAVRDYLKATGETVRGFKPLHGVDVTGVSKWERGEGDLSRTTYDLIMAIVTAAPEAAGATD